MGVYHLFHICYDLCASDVIYICLERKIKKKNQTLKIKNKSKHLKNLKFKKT